LVRGIKEYIKYNEGKREYNYVLGIKASFGIGLLGVLIYIIFHGIVNQIFYPTSSFFQSLLVLIQSNTIDIILLAFIVPLFIKKRKISPANRDDILDSGI